MANFDSQPKRYSGLGLDLPFAGMLPKPTGAVDAAARQQFLHKYVGIAFGASAAIAYGLDDLQTMMALFIYDEANIEPLALIRHADYDLNLSERVHYYLQDPDAEVGADVRDRTGKDDLNTACWLDLKT